MTSLSATERVRPRREDVRGRILEAAVEVFFRDGYDGASIQRIATAAGFTKGAVYSNFASKQELFATIMSNRFSAVSLAVLEGISPGASDWRASVDQAAALISRQIDELAPLHALVIEFTLQASRDEEVGVVYRELRRAQRAELTEALRARADSLGMPEGTSFERVATTVLALISSLALERLADPELLTAHVVHDALVGALTRTP